MKILGIGVDLIQNRRIKVLINNQAFIKRTFGNKEIKYSKKILNKTNFLPKDLPLKNL